MWDLQDAGRDVISWRSRDVSLVHSGAGINGLPGESCAQTGAAGNGESSSMVTRGTSRSNVS